MCVCVYVCRLANPLYAKYFVALRDPWPGVEKRPPRDFCRSNRVNLRAKLFAGKRAFGVAAFDVLRRLAMFRARGRASQFSIRELRRGSG